jgi:hypothetical protein
LGLTLALLLCGQAAAASKLEGLLVYGNGFRFGVREPTGWRGSTGEAQPLSANVVFYREGESAESAVALFRVRLDQKADEDIAADLAADMDGYRSQYPGVEFRDLAIKHPAYKVVAKLFAVPGQFYEYVAYVNPGRGRPWVFAASLNKQRVEATADELAAFRRMIASLQLL